MRVSKPGAVGGDLRTRTRRSQHRTGPAAGNEGGKRLSVHPSVCTSGSAGSMAMGHGGRSRGRGVAILCILVTVTIIIPSFHVTRVVLATPGPRLAFPRPETQPA